jgi:pimeloyl-ACP methyl ester carboxylesterase
VAQSAKAFAFPRDFKVRNIKTSGAAIHVRYGGQGPAVVLLHGFGDTGDMWAPVATALCKDHTVVVPDLRGMGLSSHPPGGYDKKTQAQDIAQVLDRLKIETAALVTHDIGNTVGYAFAGISGAGHMLGRHRRAAAGDRTLGRPVAQSENLAL